LTNNKQTSSKIHHITPERKLFDLPKNPRKFVIDRWRAAVDSYKLTDRDQSDVGNVKNAQHFQDFMRKAVQEAKDAKQWSRYNPLITISNIHGPLCYFEELIAYADDESESAEYVDIIEDVDVSHLWAMSYLNVKVRTIIVISLARYLLTRSAFNQLRRQAQAYCIMDERL
jgi:hypothetical protein